jgi:hypothetical protein
MVSNVKMNVLIGQRNVWIWIQFYKTYFWMFLTHLNMFWCHLGCSIAWYIVFGEHICFIDFKLWFWPVNEFQDKNSHWSAFAPHFDSYCTKISVENVRGLNLVFCGFIWRCKVQVRMNITCFFELLFHPRPIIQDSTSMYQKIVFLLH